MNTYQRYFERTWISEDALFPPATWNQHEAVLLGLPRTTNAAEAWHKSFSSHMGVNKPTLWTFLDTIRDQQVLTESKIQRMRMREPVAKEKAQVKFDERLKTLVESLHGYPDNLDFLACVANLKK